MRKWQPIDINIFNYFMRRKELKIKDLEVLLSGKNAEKEAILFIMNKFQETTVYHMDKYIKCEAKIGELNKEIDALKAEVYKC